MNTKKFIGVWHESPYVEGALNVSFPVRLDTLPKAILILEDGKYSPKSRENLQMAINRMEAVGLGDLVQFGPTLLGLPKKAFLRLHVFETDNTLCAVYAHDDLEAKALHVVLVHAWCIASTQTAVLS